MAEVAVAAGAAVLILFLVGLISFRTMRKWGVVLGTVLAIIAFLTVLGL